MVRLARLEVVGEAAGGRQGWWMGGLEARRSRAKQKVLAELETRTETGNANLECVNTEVTTLQLVPRCGIRYTLLSSLHPSLSLTQYSRPVIDFDHRSKDDTTETALASLEGKIHCILRKRAKAALSFLFCVRSTWLFATVWYLTDHARIQ